MFLKHMAFLLLFLILVPAATSVASAEYWVGGLCVGVDIAGGGTWFGAQPGWQDGYDGQSPVNISGFSGILFAHYRTWGGSGAFYHIDLESPIPAGGSKTWPDIWLWSQSYTPVFGNCVRVAYEHEPAAPTGYWARLFLDYVPDSLGWTGPWQFDFPLDHSTDGFYLPVPITDNPYDPMQVTRMHLTVYTTPIPEPSSLLALGGGLGAVGGLVLRRRRK